MEQFIDNNPFGDHKPEAAPSRQSAIVHREKLEKHVEAVPHPVLRQYTLQALQDVLRGAGSGFSQLQGSFHRPSHRPEALIASLPAL